MAETLLLDSEGIDRSLRRIAHEMLERHSGSEPLCLVGIHTRGVPLAGRLGGLCREFDPARPGPLVGALDVSFHRDDLDAKIPIPKETLIPFDLRGRSVVLVDDVLFSGRTVRAALNAILDLGRASAVELAVLVDRGHRQMPIRPDYVGKNVPTARGDSVRVRLREIDGADEVILTGVGA